MISLFTEPIHHSDLLNAFQKANKDSLDIVEANQRKISEEIWDLYIQKLKNPIDIQIVNIVRENTK